MQNLVMSLFVAASVMLPTAVSGMTAPALPPSAFADTEVSTNIVLAQASVNVSGLTVSYFLHVLRMIVPCWTR